MKKTFFLLIILSHSLSFGQSREWLTLGIVRTDGIIVPTFRFEENKWRNITNKMDEFTFYESRLRKWYFIPFSGEPYYLNVGSLVNYDADNDMHSGYGYLSDFPRTALTRNIFPIQKVGVCLSKEYPISIMNPIEDSTTQYKEIFNLVSQAKIEVDTNFLRLEYWDEYIGKNHYVDFTNINLKGTNLETFGIYYFETYNFFGEAGCQTIIYRSGWIIKINDDYRLIKDFIGFDDCDFKMLSSVPVTPLFAISVNDRFFLLVIQHYWEGEDFELWEITEDNFPNLGLNYN